MKRNVIRTIFFFVLVSQSILGQTSTNNQSHVEITPGFSFAGPINQMEKYLVDQGYDATIDSFLFGDVEYPIKTSSGHSLTITYFKDLKLHKKIGLQLSYSDLGTITGYNNDGRSVNIGFRTFSTSVFNAYDYKPWRLKIGPSVHLNTFYEEEFETKKSLESGFALGIFAGVDIYLWNSRRTYGLLGCNYTYTTANKISPPSDGFNGREQLSEVSIGFKHATASFTFGIHL